MGKRRAPGARQKPQPGRQSGGGRPTPRRTMDTGRGPAAEATRKSAPAGPDAAKPALPAWKRWGAKFWIGAAAVATGALGIWLAGWLGFFAGPPPVLPSPAPSAKPSVNPGHLPGRLDVSTLSAGHRFYAVPNFYDFQGCGRPCWLPLYQSPTEHSAFVTDGWPCEYYGPNYSSSPSCTRPPSRRAPSQMAEPAARNSGDRILVVCQVKVNTAIHNEVGQASNIWDMVAVPRADISSDSAAGPLKQVPGMPGFYQAFGPDIWLGNTGWHDIPCKY